MVPPTFVGPPHMCAVCVDFKDRAQGYNFPIGTTPLEQPFGPPKNDSCWQWTWSRLELQRNHRFYVLPKCDFRSKIRFFFFQKAPKICWTTDIYFVKGYFFVCITLPGRGQNIVWGKKWILFLGPKIRILAQKSVFCYWTPDYVNVLFVALGKTFDCATVKFRETAVFVKKKLADATKSLPPPHCGGTVCQ